MFCIIFSKEKGPIGDWSSEGCVEKTRDNLCLMRNMIASISVMPWKDVCRNPGRTVDGLHSTM